MLDSARPGNVGYVDQTIDSVFHFDEGAEVGEIAHSSLNSRADLITLIKCLPGIILHLLHSQANAAGLRIDAEDLNNNFIARVHKFAGMLHAFGPAHFRNVDQPFNARFQFDERTVISYAGNFPVQLFANWKPLFNAAPGIGQQLFVAERNTLALAIELEYLYLNSVAYSKEISRALQASPGHVGNMQQPVNSTQVYKGAVVCEILNLTLYDDVFFDLAQRLSLAIRILIFQYRLARKDDV